MPVRVHAPERPSTRGGRSKTRLQIGATLLAKVSGSVQGGHIVARYQSVDVDIDVGMAVLAEPHGPDDLPIRKNIPYQNTGFSG